MKKKLRFWFFCIALIVCMAPTAFAAQSLTDGGTIVLERDMTLSKDWLDITKDTVLDLNGHKLKLRGDNTEISIEPDVTVSIYNGVLDIETLSNAGTIECMEGVTIPKGQIVNRGHIDVIRNCDISSYRYPETGNQIPAIENMGGSIDLIENTQLPEGGITLGGYKKIYDENNLYIGQDLNFIPRIGTIRNCKIVSNDAAITNNHSCIDLVEDCILVSLNDGAASTAFGALELYPQGTINAVRDCVLVGYAPGAVHHWTNSEPVASYENCTFIAPQWEGCLHGGFDEEAQGYYYLKYPLTTAKNCTFHRLNSVDLDDYTAWEMPPLPEHIPTDPGLKNFKAVNPYTPGQFTDVPVSHWSSANVAPIYALYRAGVLTGNDALGTFGPETSISRAAASAILARMAEPALRKNVTI